MKGYEMKSLSQRMMRIGKEAWKVARENLANEKLSNIQYNIAYVVLNNPGISQDGISNSLHLDKSSVAKLVVKLIDIGYLRRETNPDDRREYKLYLTDKGSEEIAELDQLLSNWEIKVFGEKETEEYKYLNNILEDIEKKIFK